MRRTELQQTERIYANEGGATEFQREGLPEDTVRYENLKKPIKS